VHIHFFNLCMIPILGKAYTLSFSFHFLNHFELNTGYDPMTPGYKSGVLPIKLIELIITKKTLNFLGFRV